MDRSQLHSLSLCTAWQGTGIQKKRCETEPRKEKGNMQF